ncbi:MAG: hypothetical protein IPL02_05645 [Moraxellaceae bacterium]|nr:hypothetical protein [Moraxellaceae bacterium]
MPPAGTRSLFDHIIAQNDGLPYPFSKLIALLKAQNPDNTEPLTLLIPNGRSLLKGQADNQHPRIVVASDFDQHNTETGLGMATRGQLFLGFVENANEIEVLSYNEAAGRFEFQLVQNYCAGCVPRIVYARRAICTTCHQGVVRLFFRNAHGTKPTVNKALPPPLLRQEAINKPILVWLCNSL